MRRCFVALEVPDATRAALVGAQGQLAALQDPVASIRLSAPGNLHLTLKFLGPTTDAQLSHLHDALSALAAQRDEVHAELCGFDAFRRAARPQSVYAAVAQGSAAITHLMDAVDRACSELGFAEEKLPRVPHVTLARVKHAEPVGVLCRWLAKAPQQAWGKVDGGGFTLFESTPVPQGTIYAPLARFSLSSCAP